MFKNTSLSILQLETFTVSTDLLKNVVLVGSYVLWTMYATFGFNPDYVNSLSFHWLHDWYEGLWQGTVFTVKCSQNQRTLVGRVPFHRRPSGHGQWITNAVDCLHHRWNCPWPRIQFWTKPVQIRAARCWAHVIVALKHELLSLLRVTSDKQGYSVELSPVIV